MIPSSLGELARYCGGTAYGSDSVTVTAPADTDSRTVVPGGLFVAVPGDNVDGHDFADAALEAGAAAVLCSKPVSRPCIVTDDVTVALGKIARGVLERLDGLQVVAVTGSQGKTTVKDLLRHTLAALGPVVAPVASYNNELGVPLTALRVTEQTRFLVVEMGARGIGHIRKLCAITPPDVSVVLNVGTAHVGEFGSLDAIAEAKSEIVQALEPEGIALLNDDDQRVRAMANVSRGQVVTFGSSADVGIDNIALDENGHVGLRLLWEGQDCQVRVPLIGKHQAGNVAAASAAALVLGASLDAVSRTLATAVPDSPMRLAREYTPAGALVLDDSYNANPESMAAGLRVLAELAQRDGGGRAYAVLGEMLELGPRGDQAHRDIGKLSRSLHLDEVIVVGDGALPIAEGAGDIATVVPDPMAAVSALAGRLRNGDVVLVKASRQSEFERVADELTGRHGHTP